LQLLFYVPLCHFFLPFATLPEAKGYGQAGNSWRDKDLRELLQVDSAKMWLLNSTAYGGYLKWHLRN
jgi:hypothetical protein